MRTEFAPSCPASIFIAGDHAKAREICRAYCDEVGFCVTVTATTYIYTNGEEAGVIVGLINYPRFPAEPINIEAKAIELGMRLRDALGQESFSVQTPTTTTWFSWREAALASAMSAGTAATPQSGAGLQPASAVGEAETPITQSTD